MANIHALIIDDNPDNSDILARMLKKEGASYLIMSDARRLTAEHVADVDVVFLDLEMPGLDGYQTFAKLRTQLQVNAPIVAYTVHHNEKTTVRDMGFDGMLSKPLDPTCFSDQLQRILQGVGLWDDC